ncbi:hypothetical protein MKI84_08465 [Ancylobacter sp. A5.8]|uniref:hypothetical protein n=1 Tax=Ancylobacter gelatini TaxID=2919920 RepID=UPI001F4D494D|nr:hypothetical protein [Ancylobacter gelatini]MCJ8142948.1 hypothetical protein [Ancylobacter gelatini]
MSRRRVPHVTDHAVIRYLERSRGFDIEAVRREIGRKVARGVEAGACGVVVDGVRFILRDALVVTVMDSGSPRGHSPADEGEP